MDRSDSSRTPRLRTVVEGRIRAPQTLSSEVSRTQLRGVKNIECRTSTPPDNNNPGQVPLLFRVGQVPPDNSPRPTTSVSLGITVSRNWLAMLTPRSTPSIFSSLQED